jgi:hypothetical protein
MLPLELDGPVQGGVGEETLPLRTMRSSAFEYATAAPSCAADLSHTVYDLPEAIRDAFTLDGAVDMWRLPECATVLEQMRSFACAPRTWPEWLWCRYSRGGDEGYGQSVPHMMPVRPF